MDICRKIGRNIKKIRVSKKLSQEELAYNAGIDRSYLSEIESGYKNLSVLILAQIARALKTDIKELF